MVDISKLAVGAQVKVNGKPYTVVGMESYGLARPGWKRVLLRNPRTTEDRMYQMGGHWSIGIPHDRFGLQRVKPVESFEVVGGGSSVEAIAADVQKLLK